MKIWQRHLFAQLAKTFFFALFCIFTLYVVVDFSVHGVRFLSGSSTFTDLIFYYLHSFATLLELFLTLTFLLATLRVLFDLNAHRELLALQMAGLSKKRLLVPFFLFAAFLSAVCYVNNQYTDTITPPHKTKKKKAEQLYSVTLKDDSELVYQSFDGTKKEFFDVFWVQTPNEIWHMKYLQIDPLRGHYVNHLTRNGEKQLQKEASFIARDFPELPWDENAPLHRPLERSHLYYQLLVPLMPLLVLFAIAPISTRYSRNQPFFLIAACSLFGFIALKVVLDGMLILGENQVVPAFLAIFGPILIALAFSLPNFAKMK